MITETEKQLDDALDAIMDAAKGNPAPVSESTEDEAPKVQGLMGEPVARAGDRDGNGDCSSCQP